MYKFIVDPGHGWLKVPLNEIHGLKFSSYSFRDNKYAYLEEDVDAGIFISARGLTEHDWEVVQVDSFDRSMRRLV